MKALSFVFLAACAGPPEPVRPACRGVYNECVGRCSRNPTVSAQEGDGHGMPVEPGEARAFNGDTAAESCLSSCRGETKVCNNKVVSVPASMPSEAP